MNNNKSIEINRYGLIPFIDILICPECKGKTGIEIGESKCPDCNINIIWVKNKKEKL